MIIEQLPAIAQDLGVQKDAKDRVKGMLTSHRISFTTLTQDIEKLAYDAMMSGIQTGFSYGWRLGQNSLLEQQKADRALLRGSNKTTDHVQDTNGYKQAVEKACKWLDKMALSSSFINSFKKEMEEA